MSADLATLPGAPDRPMRRRLRPLIGFLSVLVLLLIVWEVVKVIGGERWKVDSLFGTGHRHRLGAALRVPVRDRRQAAPHLGDRARVRRHRCQRADDPAAADRRSPLHAAERGDRVRPGIAAGPGARHPARPRPAARTLVGADHRGQPDDPDHRHRPAHRHRAQGGLVRGRDRRYVPDVLPGHHRGPARAASLRSARPRADALLRRLTWRDPAQAAAAGLPSVPVHRLPDRRPGRSRRRDRRRAAVADPGWARSPDHHRHAVLLAQRRVPVGGHRRLGGARDRGLPAGRRRWNRGSCATSAGSTWWVRDHGRRRRARPPGNRSSRSRASPRCSPPAARAPGRWRPSSTSTCPCAPASSSR